MTALYAALSPELLAFAERRVATRQDAEDLVQQVWAAFAKTSETQLIGAPRAWLYRALRNRITDGYRRKITQPLIVPLEAVSFGESRPTVVPPNPAPRTAYPAPRTADLAPPTLDAADFWEQVDTALAELPAVQAETFRRSVIDGETLGAIALSHGVPVRTAISRKRYARERLVGLLGDLYEDYFGEG